MELANYLLWGDSKNRVFDNRCVLNSHSIGQLVQNLFSVLQYISSFTNYLPILNNDF